MRGEKFLLVLSQCELYSLLLMCQLQMLWDDYCVVLQMGAPVGCFLLREVRLVWSGRGGSVGC